MKTPTNTTARDDRFLQLLELAKEGSEEAIGDLHKEFPGQEDV